MAYTERYTSYFICPSCFEPVIEYDKLKDMEYDLSKHNFCTNCGHEINCILQQERQIRLKEVGKTMKENELKETAERIAEKYAVLVEKRIDRTEDLTGTDLHDIYEGIQMLGHVVATLERFSRMKDKD